MAQRTDTPDFRAAAHAALAKKWDFVDTLLAGTDEVRQAGTAMLVQFPAESDKSYQARLSLTTYDNGYSDALDAAVGTLLRKPPKLGDSVPALIRQDAEDVDLAGTHLNVFINRLTRKAIHYGAAYVLVEKPSLPVGLKDKPVRLADAERLNLRPYWTLYAAAQVQSAPRYVTISNRAVLQQIVFRECTMEPDGAFGEAEKVRYRVYRLPVERLPNRQYQQTGPVEWELWEETKDEATKASSVIQIDGGSLPANLSGIPVAVFIANPDGDDERQTCGPVFYDLAELSRKDYNQRSDYERSLHICASPIPVVVNLKEAEEVEGAPKTERVFGPGELMECADGGSFSWAEPAGTGLAAYEALLERNQQQMRLKGFETMYADASVATTATEQLLRAGKRASRLAQINEALHDCLEAALRFSAQWRGLGEDAGGEVTMGATGDELILDPAQLQALQQQATAGQLSLRTLWQIQQRAGLLPDDFNVDEELALLADERQRLQADASSGRLTQSPSPHVVLGAARAAEAKQAA